MKSSPEIDQITAALCRFQAKITPIPKNKSVKIPSRNGDIQFSYADLTQIVETVKRPLTEEGLCFTQGFFENEGITYIRTCLLHVSGQFLISEKKFIEDGSVKDMGTRLTYQRRYQLAAILGIVSDDDLDAKLEIIAKKDFKADGDVISSEAAYMIARRLHGHDELKKRLLSICKVPSIAQIKKTQKDAVNKFMKANKV